MQWNIIKKISSRQTISFFLLLGTLVISSPLYAHKYYVSSVTIEQNADTLDVNMSIFYDDMQVAIYENYHKYIRLCPIRDNKKHEAEGFVFSYVKDRFSIKADTLTLLPMCMGYVCGEETIEVKLRYILSSSIVKSIQVTDRVLMDIYPEQRNIIQFSSVKRRMTHLLSLGRESALLDVQ